MILLQSAHTTHTSPNTVTRRAHHARLASWLCWERQPGQIASADSLHQIATRMVSAKIVFYLLSLLVTLERSANDKYVFSRWLTAFLHVPSKALHVPKGTIQILTDFKRAWNFMDKLSLLLFNNNNNDPPIFACTDRILPRQTLITTVSSMWKLPQIVKIQNGTKCNAIRKSPSGNIIIGSMPLLIMRSSPT